MTQNFDTSLNKLTPLEQELLNKNTKIEAWLRDKWLQHKPPFYGSVDLRNAGYKISPIDMNLFPGGFNNLNQNFMMGAVIATQEAVSRICADAKSLLIIPENHTRNTFYLENVYTLSQILIKAGFKIRIGTINPEINEITQLNTIKNHKINVEPIIRENNRLYLEDGFSPCAIILNNDLSAGIPNLLKNLDQAVTPPVFASWTIRTKSRHFSIFDKIMGEFSQEIGIDPWLINPYFDNCSNLDFSSKFDSQELVDKTSDLLKKIQQKYNEYRIKDKPFIIIKADSGTYGMGVMTVKSPEDILSLNRKNRNKMATVKEGLVVHNVILQEGVYSYEKIENSVAEPVVYMIDRFVVGGFYRAHEGRANNENLNASGMRFIPLYENLSTVQENIDILNPKHHFTQWDIQALPVLDKLNSDKANRFYIYSIIARLSLHAASIELERGIDQFNNQN
ncbi:MAG: glutamate--cysteine ligase [Neisseriaceae bacterium]|nr:MAG: glutamate--cysteine ligase [Neisseriaceae bacterium]